MEGVRDGHTDGGCARPGRLFVGVLSADPVPPFDRVGVPSPQ